MRCPRCVDQYLFLLVSCAASFHITTIFHLWFYERNRPLRLALSARALQAWEAQMGRDRRNTNWEEKQGNLLDQMLTHVRVFARASGAVPDVVLQEDVGDVGEDPKAWGQVSRVSRVRSARLNGFRRFWRPTSCPRRGPITAFLLRTE